MISTASRVENIQKWKYDSKDYSIIYPIVRKWLVAPSAAYIPGWMSPNVITVIGFLFTLFSVIWVMTKDTLSVLNVHLICWASFFAFFFDALDGEQGRAWRNEKRDVYVLTQLFDHGFDSLTAILNVYLIGRVLVLDQFLQKVVFLIILSTFIVSTMEYKVNRILVFGTLNNPTESVFLNIILLTLGSIFQPIPYNIKLYGIFLLAICVMLSNSYNLLKIFKSGNSGERVEILDLFMLFGVIITTMELDSPIHRLISIEIALLFHIMVLRLICCEITKENCPFELCLFIIPISFVNTFGIVNTSLHLVIIALYTIYVIWIWISETSTICSALKMDNAFSKPPPNNNPFQ